MKWDEHLGYLVQQEADYRLLGDSKLQRRAIDALLASDLFLLVRSPFFSSYLTSNLQQMSFLSHLHTVARFGRKEIALRSGAWA
jgi:hypothetical protein